MQFTIYIMAECISPQAFADREPGTGIVLAENQQRTHFHISVHSGIQAAVCVEGILVEAVFHPHRDIFRRRIGAHAGADVFVTPGIHLAYVHGDVPAILALGHAPVEFPPEGVAGHGQIVVGRRASHQDAAAVPACPAVPGPFSVQALGQARVAAFYDNIAAVQGAYRGKGRGHLRSIHHFPEGKRGSQGPHYPVHHLYIESAADAAGQGGPVAEVLPESHQ